MQQDAQDHTASPSLLANMTSLGCGSFDHSTVAFEQTLPPMEDTDYGSDKEAAEWSTSDESIDSLLQNHLQASQYVLQDGIPRVVVTSGGTDKSSSLLANSYQGAASAKDSRTSQRTDSVGL